ncbi:hypothetical protein [Nocardia sp. NPDC004722]
MTKNKARKRATRARSAESGISHTAAHFTDPRGAGDPAILERMRLTGASPELAARMVNDARAYYAQHFTAEDNSWDARRAWQAAEAVEAWEQRRAGRLVRWWKVYVDIWAAAVDENEAADRLTYYQRQLYHYVPGIDCPAWDLSLAAPQPIAERDEVCEVAAADLLAEQRAALVADYSRAAWAFRDKPRALYGARETAHIDDYVSALKLAALRREVGITARQDERLRQARGPLPADPSLRFWRAQRYTDVLAGPDEGSARARGEQLAATVVDYLGRPVGRLAAVEPEDGFVSATDGHWVHPAEDAYWKTRDALWEDYDRYTQTSDHDRALAEVFTRAATQLHDSWKRDRRETAEFEAGLHTQPDGRRTQSTPMDFALVEQETRQLVRTEGMTVAQMRALADEDDYMADRVYGKVVQNADDAKRIERVAHRATILRALADQADPTVTRTTDIR